MEKYSRRIHLRNDLCQLSWQNVDLNRKSGLNRFSVISRNNFSTLRLILNEVTKKIQSVDCFWVWVLTYFKWTKTKACCKNFLETSTFSFLFV